LYEKDEIAYFKTHYYGGIKKYQWGVTPLALHGRIMLADGTAIDLEIGEHEGDPVFVVTDLLPHLAQKQNERKLSEGLRGEELNIVLGSTPIADKEVKAAFKLKILSILNEKYGITEADFLRAELTMVPAQKAVDVGFDRSLIGAYGQDDKVCAYTALMAELDAVKPEYTTVTVLVDKEEIGSEGVSGMASDMLLHYMEDLVEAEGERVRDVLRNSLCLSADVNAAYDPTFADVYELQNASFINKGPVLTKYTGARGKSGSNDASAETMQKVIKYMDDEEVMWQIGELGKVDAGGGGTIAKFIADMDVDTVDLGVPVLSMHAPLELTSKLDVYYTYKAFKAFNK
jgi:aspartyl aminopeptidase